MGRLTVLKPRLSVAPSQRIKAHYVERMRGEANQKRRARLLSANPLCAYCAEQGRVSAAVEIDHRVPLWAGGSDSDANCVPTCVACHREKTAKEAAERYQK